MLCRVCVACEGANGGAAEVRGDLEGWEAAAGVNGSRQSWFLLISSQLTVRKHSQGLFACATDTHTRLMALFPAIPGWAGTRKVKPIWILLKQETLSGSGISWAVCKSASSSRQLTTPAPHHSVFYGADALPAAQPTASKHWMPKRWRPKYLCRRIMTFLVWQFNVVALALHTSTKLLCFEPS